MEQDMESENSMDDKADKSESLTFGGGGKSVTQTAPFEPRKDVPVNSGNPDLTDLLHVEKAGVKNQTIGNRLGAEQACRVV